MTGTGGAADDHRPTGASGDGWNAPVDPVEPVVPDVAPVPPAAADGPDLPWEPDVEPSHRRSSVVPVGVVELFSDQRVRIGLGLVAAVGVGLLVGGLVFGGSGEPETGQGPSLAAEATPTATPAPEPAFEPVATVVDAPRPVAIAIPDLGIDQSLVDLVVSPEGKMGVPAEWMDIGWWADGPAPGESGGAVIAGHVNGGGAPAVFAQLPTLAIGAQVVVAREDGSSATYVVRSKEQFAKDDFPDARVYTFAGPSYLHLVTCGGTFDRRSGHYDDNIVVFAELVSVTPA